MLAVEWEEFIFIRFVLTEKFISFCVWIVCYRSCWCCGIVTEAAAVMEIEVHRLTHNPTAAWKKLSKKQKVINLQVIPPTSNVTDDKVRYAFGIHCV
jgi:hypothetical protein